MFWGLCRSREKVVYSLGSIAGLGLIVSLAASFDLALEKGSADVLGHVAFLQHLPPALEDAVGVLHVELVWKGAALRRELAFEKLVFGEKMGIFRLGCLQVSKNLVCVHLEDEGICHFHALGCLEAPFVATWFLVESVNLSLHVGEIKFEVFRGLRQIVQDTGLVTMGGFHLEAKGCDFLDALLVHLFPFFWEHQMIQQDLLDALCQILVEGLDMRVDHKKGVMVGLVAQHEASVFVLGVDDNLAHGLALGCELSNVIKVIVVVGNVFLLLLRHDVREIEGMLSLL